MVLTDCQGAPAPLMGAGWGGGDAAEGVCGSQQCEARQPDFWCLRLLSAASFTPTLPSPIEGEDFPKWPSCSRTPLMPWQKLREYHSPLAGEGLGGGESKEQGEVAIV
jgi:hypothetical protein